MFNKNLLKAELVANDIKMIDFAKKLGINKSTLSKKMNGKSDWVLSEIVAISKLIGEEKAKEIFLP